MCAVYLVDTDTLALDLLWYGVTPVLLAERLIDLRCRFLNYFFDNLEYPAVEEFCKVRCCA